MKTQTTYSIHNALSGHVLGEYEGATEREALDAMARDAGYRDHEHACEASGDDGSDLRVTRTSNNEV